MSFNNVVSNQKLYAKSISTPGVCIHCEAVVLWCAHPGCSLFACFGNAFYVALLSDAHFLF